MTDTSSEQQHAITTNSFFIRKAFTVFVALLAFTVAFSSTFRNNLSAAFNKPTTRTMSTSAAMKITKRPWNARGKADHGWLYSFHTFSFASYYDPRHESFGPLRVINEDRVKPGTGFGEHRHDSFAIWSYIVGGTLEHRDSMGNLENLKRGEVQFTNAGTGIRHSEYNRNKDEEVHFLQIWAKLNKSGMKPHYETKKFTDEQKTDNLCRIIEFSSRLGSGKEAIGIEADIAMEASILSPGKTVSHELVASGPRKVLAQVVMTKRLQPKEGGASIKIGDTVLGEGDGAYIEIIGPGKLDIQSVGDKPAEFLLFDMGPEEQ